MTKDELNLRLAHYREKRQELVRAELKVKELTETYRDEFGKEFGIPLDKQLELYELVGRIAASID